MSGCCLFTPCCPERVSLKGFLWEQLPESLAWRGKVTVIKPGDEPGCCESLALIVFSRIFAEAMALLSFFDAPANVVLATLKLLSLPIVFIFSSCSEMCAIFWQAMGNYYDAICDLLLGLTVLYGWLCPDGMYLSMQNAKIESQMRLLSLDSIELEEATKIGAEIRDHAMDVTIRHQAALKLVRKLENQPLDQQVGAVLRLVNELMDVSFSDANPLRDQEIPKALSNAIKHAATLVPPWNKLPLILEMIDQALVRYSRHLEVRVTGAILTLRDHLLQKEGCPCDEIISLSKKIRGLVGTDQDLQVYKQTTGKMLESILRKRIQPGKEGAFTKDEATRFRSEMDEYGKWDYIGLEQLFASSGLANNPATAQPAAAAAAGAVTVTSATEGIDLKEALALTPSPKDQPTQMPAPPASASPDTPQQGTSSSERPATTAALLSPDNPRTLLRNLMSDEEQPSPAAAVASPAPAEVVVEEQQPKPQPQQSSEAPASPRTPLHAASPSPVLSPAAAAAAASPAPAPEAASVKLPEQALEHKDGMPTQASLPNSPAPASGSLEVPAVAGSQLTTPESGVLVQAPVMSPAPAAQGQRPENASGGKSPRSPSPTGSIGSEVLVGSNNRGLQSPAGSLPPEDEENDPRTPFTTPLPRQEQVQSTPRMLPLTALATRLGPPGRVVVPLSMPKLNPADVQWLSGETALSAHLREAPQGEAANATPLKSAGQPAAASEEETPERSADERSPQGSPQSAAKQNNQARADFGFSPVPSVLSRVTERTEEPTGTLTPGSVGRGEPADASTPGSAPRAPAAAAAMKPAPHLNVSAAAAAQPGAESPLPSPLMRAKAAVASLRDLAVMGSPQLTDQDRQELAALKRQKSVSVLLTPPPVTPPAHTNGSGKPAQVATPPDNFASHPTVEHVATFHFDDLEPLEGDSQPQIKSPMPDSKEGKTSTNGATPSPAPALMSPLASPLKPAFIAYGELSFTSDQQKDIAELYRLLATLTLPQKYLQEGKLREIGGRLAKIHPCKLLEFVVTTETVKGHLHKMRTNSAIMYGPVWSNYIEHSGKRFDKFHEEFLHYAEDLAKATGKDAAQIRKIVSQEKADKWTELFDYMRA